MSTRLKCERVGCPKFSFDVQPIVIHGRTIKLCKRCRAYVFDKASRKELGEDSLMGVVKQFISDSYDSIANTIKGVSSDKVLGVRLWRPWSDIEQSNTGVDDKIILSYRPDGSGNVGEL